MSAFPNESSHPRAGAGDGSPEGQADGKPSLPKGVSAESIEEIGPPDDPLQGRQAGDPLPEGAPAGPDDPTPEQIEQRSEEIRRRWSDRVRKNRHLRAPTKWTVPDVPIADLDQPGG